LSSVTQEQIKKRYKEIAYGDFTIMKASTIRSLIDSNGCTLRDAPSEQVLYDVFFFFDRRDTDNRVLDSGTGKVSTEKERKKITLG
jgi:hypothetical protein